MRFSLFFIFIFWIPGCNSDRISQKNLKIEGRVKYPNNEFIYLDILTPEGYAKLDSCMLNGENEFLLEIPIDEVAIYRINFFNKQINTLILNDHDVVIEADGNAHDGQFHAVGSEEVSVISKAGLLRRSFTLQEGMLGQKLRTANSKQNISAIDSLLKVHDLLSRQYEDEIIKLLESQEGSLTALLILTEIFDMEPNLNLYTKQLHVMQDKIGDHWYFEKVYDQFKKIERTAIGSVAPDFMLKDPEGNQLELSSFRGKYLFLDFWASWCQPCRVENPKLVKVYDRFQGQNFEILGVSFDKRKDRWTGAIEKDGLTWHHVSDLKYLDSEMVALYNIANVPTTFLLDPEGVIIAKDLHAADLEKILKERLQQ